MHDFTEEREAYLDALVDRLDQEGDWAEDYATKHDDSPYAKYVAWGWTEGDLSEVLSRAYEAIEYAIDDDTELGTVLTYLKAMAEVQGEKETLDFIFNYCEVQSGCGLHQDVRAIYGMFIGGTEHEISEELKAELAKLTEEEHSYVAGRSNYSLSGDYLYIDCSYDSWEYRLVNEEGLVEAIEADIEQQYFADVWHSLCQKFREDYDGDMTRYRFGFDVDALSAAERIFYCGTYRAMVKARTGKDITDDQALAAAR